MTYIQGGGNPDYSLASSSVSASWPEAVTWTYQEGGAGTGADPAGGFKLYAPDGSDQSGLLTTPGDGTASVTAAGLLGYLCSGYWVCQALDAGAEPIGTYRWRLGDAEGWMDAPLDEGTFVDVNGYITARTNNSFDVKDTVQAAADRGYVYWEIDLPADPAVIQTRYVQDAGTYANDYATVCDLQITDDLAALDGSGYTLASGGYVDALHFMRTVLTTTKDGSQQNAAYYGTVSSAVFSKDRKVAGYMVAAPVDINGDAVAALGHKEVSAIGTNYSTPANLYAVASAFSFKVKNGGVDKTLSGSWQIRVSA